MPVGRLAPSPTGRLHIGHAWTFLLAWCHVRARGGRVLLRLEDLDEERCRPRLASGVLTDLEWLGLEWDGPVVYQSARRAVLLEHAERLRREGLAYSCVCTRSDIRQALGAPHRGDGELWYPGTCRARLGREPAAPSRSGHAPALRFVVPPGEVEIVDGIAGASRYDVGKSVGDFVIARGNVPAYQLAVVVDDAWMGVNEVFRGEDLLASTPRQLLLQRALGLAAPRWFHAPLVVDASGRRLAKRADDLSLAALRAQGVEARALIGWLAHRGGLGQRARTSASELCARFDLSRLRRAPLVVPEACVEELLALP